MSATSKIEWTEATWNPLVGCTKVSPGCDNCYAETQVNTRFHPAALAKGGKHLEAFPTPFETVSIRPDRFLTQPLHWPAPKRIFVNSLSDLFHDDVPAVFIARVFAVMALSPRHTYQLLTKRHGRMQALLGSAEFLELLDRAVQEMAVNVLGLDAWAYSYPLANVHGGVSAENQQWAIIRGSALLRTPFAVRWISAEPLLGPIELTYNRFCKAMGWGPPAAPSRHISAEDQLLTQTGWLLGPPGSHSPRINWVVAGGESGPGARPMHPDWARSLRDQCVAAGVPFLFKQWGNWAPFPVYQGAEKNTFVMNASTGEGTYYSQRNQPGNAEMWNVGKKAAGRVLDGRTWDEYPVGDSS